MTLVEAVGLLGLEFPLVARLALANIASGPDGRLRMTVELASLVPDVAAFLDALETLGFPKALCNSADFWVVGPPPSKQEHASPP